MPPGVDESESAAAMLALEEADPALLLASLAMWHGDPDIAARQAHAFTPSTGHFGPRLLGAAHGLNDVDCDVAAEIRSAALLALTHNSRVAASDEVSDAGFGPIASLVVAETVGDDYVAMLREQSGFEKARRRVPVTRAPGPDYEVVIIGCGMSGITAAVKLAEAGFAFKIFEKAPAPGGTWVINRYPGAAVDTPSHFYSFSYELNPEWELYYPTGPEYLRYLDHVMDKYAIREHLKCSTQVVGCTWHADRGQYEITTESGGQTETHWARAVISAVGFLNGPNKPDLAGADTFNGTVMHSAEWDDSVELEDKNVVLVGAACTAVQIATAVAETSKHLSIVQRQRQWVVPARTGTPVSDAERWLLANVPYYHNWFRLRAFWHSGASGANHRLGIIDEEWSKTHISASPVNDQLMQVSLTYLDEMFGDRPDLKEKLTPDYPVLAKRLIMDPGYYPTLKRPDVSLYEGAVDHLEPDAVVTSDGTRLPCDVLVLATGFKAEWLAPVVIRGRDGVRLKDAWGDDPRAYLGVCVPGFPNFFMTCGPNSAPAAGGHNLTCEEQVHYIVECLQAMVERDLQSMEVSAEATRQYNDRQDDEIDKMVWGHPKVRSYQHNAAGRGLVWTVWKALDYWTWLREPDLADFTLEAASR